MKNDEMVERKTSKTAQNHKPAGTNKKGRKKRKTPTTTRTNGSKHLHKVL
jgi:hypothetical protein